MFVSFNHTDSLLISPKFPDNTMGMLRGFAKSWALLCQQSIVNKEPSIRVEKRMKW